MTKRALKRALLNVLPPVAALGGMIFVAAILDRASWEQSAAMFACVWCYLVGVWAGMR